MTVLRVVAGCDAGHDWEEGDRYGPDKDGRYVVDLWCARCGEGVADKTDSGKRHPSAVRA